MKSSIWQKLRTFLLVGALAVLVWVWADLAKIGEDETGDLELIVKLPEGMTVVGARRTMNEEWSKKIYVGLRLSGPQRELDWLKSDLEAKRKTWWPQLVIKERTTSPVDIELRDAINTRELRNRGLVVRQVEPANIQLDIGEWVTMQRPVEPLLIDEARLLPDSLSYTPQSVRVRVLLRHKSLVEGKVLRTEPIDLRNAAKGEHEVTSKIILPLDKPSAGESVEPVTLKVRFTVMSSELGTVETPVENVPIGVAGPPEVIDNYKVVFDTPNDAVVKQITVRGKADDIKALQDKRPEMLAFIVVEQEDARRTELGQTLSPHKVYFHLPEGVQLVKKPDDVPRFSLQKREPR